MTIDGTMTAPRIVGTAELRDAEVKFAGFPQLIDEINGTLRFRGDRIEIESVRATVGGGTVVAGGSIALDGHDAAERAHHAAGHRRRASATTKA